MCVLCLCVLVWFGADLSYVFVCLFVVDCVVLHGLLVCVIVCVCVFVCVVSMFVCFVIYRVVLSVVCVCLCAAKQCLNVLL